MYFYLDEWFFVIIIILVVVSYKGDVKTCLLIIIACFGHCT